MHVLTFIANKIVFFILEVVLLTRFGIQIKRLHFIGLDEYFLISEKLFAFKQMTTHSGISFL